MDNDHFSVVIIRTIVSLPRFSILFKKIETSPIFFLQNRNIGIANMEIHQPPCFVLVFLKRAVVEKY